MSIQLKWPSFHELTEEEEPHVHYYTGWEEGVLVPAFHWCYVAEITAPQYHPLRPSPLVKDHTGKEHPIVFYISDDLARSHKPFQEFKVGYTIAILYAKRKQLMDLSEGIRQENTEFKIFKCSLEKLIQESKKLELSSKECFACGKKDVKLLTCGKCKLVWYCGTDCQKSHWKHVHKSLCEDMKLLKNLVLLLTKPFQEFSSFKALESMNV